MNKLFIVFILACTFTSLTHAFCLIGKWHVIVTSDMPDNDLTIQVKSGDEDRGIHTIPFNGTYDWTFCEKFAGGILYFANFWCGSKTQSLHLFDKAIRGICYEQKLGTQHCYWIEVKLSNIESENQVLEKILICKDYGHLLKVAEVLISVSFGRTSQGLRASPQSRGLSFLDRVLGRLDDLRQVEAKYPALLFKQQITAFLK
ncbi:plant self-incompatibility S1 [Artemisia annua]|uniref:S-protein homolog n=1 Tax=Artemisia annua TaxID=35608 RepID=A0A2U1PDE3_ARTAN|nr:plant self-incompatibility S1 [Artemisia annua]